MILSESRKKNSIHTVQKGVAYLHALYAFKCKFPVNNTAAESAVIVCCVAAGCLSIYKGYTGYFLTHARTYNTICGIKRTQQLELYKLYTYAWSTHSRVVPLICR